MVRPSTHRSGQPSKFIQRGDLKKLKGVYKNPQRSSQDLSTVCVKEDLSTTKLFTVYSGRRIERRKPFALLEKHQKFTGENLDKVQDFCGDVLWTNESTLDLFRHQPKACFQKKKTGTNHELRRWKGHNLKLLWLQPVSQRDLPEGHVRTYLSESSFGTGSWNRTTVQKLAENSNRESWNGPDLGSFERMWPETGRSSGKLSNPLQR